MLNNRGDGVRYAFTKQNVAVYEFLLAGRVLMIVAVDQNDKHFHIMIRKPDDVGVDPIMTSGRGVPSESDPERVSSISVQGFVWENLAYLLAALYVDGFAEHVASLASPLTKTKPADPTLN